MTFYRLPIRFTCFYSNFSRLANEISEIYDFIIMFTFLFTLTNVSSSLLILNYELVEWISIKTNCSFFLLFNSEFDRIMFVFFKAPENSFDSVVCMKTCVFIFWTFVSIILYCECGEGITNEFDKFHYEVDQYKWHLLPLEMQKMAIIVLANSQQPTLIRGYGNIVCRRETFKNVRASNCSETTSMMINNF